MMNTRSFFVSLLVFLTGVGVFAAGVIPSRAAQGNEPIRVIFDTDMWSDIDDTLALAMLHALQDRHDIRLLAVTISTQDPSCVPYVDLVDTFYGHPQIPIGTVRGGMRLEDFRKKFPGGVWPITRFAELISQQKTYAGSPLYPRSASADVPEAVSLLREIMATQPDKSIVLVEVGYSTNLAHLLDSTGDSASPLGGRDLVAKKVRLLSIMAGNFGESKFNGKVVAKGSPEFNLAVDVRDAQEVFSSWPAPIVASGFEIGSTMLYPGRRISDDYSYVEHHPIADTYRAYCNEIKDAKHCPQDHDHPTFDMTAVLYAARPDENYFSLSNPGQITVRDDGSSRFDESPEGLHRYLILDEANKGRALEAMAMLASQPPMNAARR